MDDDIRRLWNGSSDRVWEILDRACTARRASEPGSDVWARARLAEGLARIVAAASAAEWGASSYALQAVEAALDALRDAVSSLPEDHDPLHEEVVHLREALLREWRSAQSDKGLERLSDLSITSLRSD